MRRRVVNVLAIASLLVGVCAAVLWRRSYSVCDELQVFRGRDQIWVSSDVGVCRAGNYVMPMNLAWSVEWRRVPTFVVAGQQRMTAFALKRDDVGWPKVRLFVMFPHWAAVVAGLVFPATVLIRRRRSAGSRGFPLQPNGDAKATTG